ncbi:twitching motility protein PilT [Sphingomonas metalli]|uniref:Twitching motility protein PilT n=1 Tax=Sphingomonas metalli TaxID=1779358 RepID=A0A916T3Z9_9SPHN|nr:type II toxin-antitoxin system VapC family toxin [Sphingomonas metalli]GGB27827.1 twitching motility protein PilT [Sphingomonas metalli]
MAYLLDTVALIRWWSGAANLGDAARHAIEQEDMPVHVSAVSVWEIANKIRIGKLADLPGFDDRFWAMIRADGFTMLDIGASHAMRAGYLPGPHRDPFDRLLAGQALVEDMTVLTNDAELAAFGCKVLW